MGRRPPAWLLYGLPAAVALLAFGSAAGFGFVWDDEKILVETAKFRSPEALFQGLTHAFLNYPGYFRPLPLLMLALEQMVFASSAASHAANLILHAGNTVLLAMLGARLAIRYGYTTDGARVCGTVAGVFFALHPAVIEPVAWISCRFELLLCFFCLSALCLDRLVQGALARAAAVSAAFFLAALCKEMAAGFALALPFWHLLFEDSQGTRQRLRAAIARNWLTYLGIMLAGMAYLGLRAAYLPQLYVTAQVGYASGSWQHALVVLKTLGQYLLLAFSPFTQIGPLHALQLPVSGTDPRVLAGAAMLAGLAVGLVRVLRFASAWPHALLLCCLLSLIPAINLLPVQTGDSFAQDRFLYLPLCFLSLWVVLGAAGIWRRWRSQIVIPAVVAVALCWLGLSLMSIQVTLPFWRDNLGLWTLAYMRSPESETAQAGIVQAHLGRGNLDRAFELANAIAARHGQIADDVEANLLMALAMQGRPVGRQRIEGLRARLEHRRQSGLSPEAIQNHIAWLYLLSGETNEARLAYQRALELDPLYAPAMFGLSVLYGAVDDAEKTGEYRRQWERTAHDSVKAEWAQSYEPMVLQVRQSLAAHAAKP